jgi:hypothetical protein
MTCDPTNKPSESQPKRPLRRFDAAAKELVCGHVAAGKTLEEAAEMVGFSERTIYRERRRDPIFKLRISKDREQIADKCINAALGAIEDDNKNWRAGEFAYKVIYPDRYYARPRTISLKAFDQWNAELLHLLTPILTADQLRQLDERLNASAAQFKHRNAR